jgi:hypothetical protein
MQLHIWEKSHSYFVVWTECDYYYTGVVAEKDTTFQRVMGLLKNYVFTHFCLYHLSKSRAEGVEEFKTTQEIRRLKKLRKVESGEQNGDSVFCARSLWEKRKSQHRRLDLNKNRFGLDR